LAADGPDHAGRNLVAWTASNKDSRQPHWHTDLDEQPKQCDQVLFRELHVPDGAALHAEQVAFRITLEDVDEEADTARRVLDGITGHAPLQA
jgi:hypothetical protein